jgi:hypothetical protein
VDDLEALRKEYNAAVANGLIVKARRIARSIAYHERGSACACVNGRYCYENGAPTRCWIRDGKPEEGD